MQIPQQDYIIEYIIPNLSTFIPEKNFLILCGHVPRGMKIE